MNCRAADAIALITKTHSFLAVILFLGGEILHLAVLLVFQRAKGALLLLPRSTWPVSVANAQFQSSEDSSLWNEHEDPWPSLLLAALRGDLSSEVTHSLLALKGELEVSYS